jgi:hypothetical protein
MTELTEAIISDSGRPPVVVQAGENGAFWIHAPKTIVALNADEAERLAAFVRDEARLMSYAVTPAKARFRGPMTDRGRAAPRGCRANNLLEALALAVT